MITFDVIMHTQRLCVKRNIFVCPSVCPCVFVFVFVCVWECVHMFVHACVSMCLCVSGSYLTLKLGRLLGMECVVGLREQGEQVHTHLLLALLFVLDLGQQRGHRGSNMMLNVHRNNTIIKRSLAIGSPQLPWLREELWLGWFHSVDAHNVQPFRAMTTVKTPWSTSCLTTKSNGLQSIGLNGQTTRTEEWLGLNGG